MTPASLLLMSDGRFPAGGHAHSVTTEAAVEYGIVSDSKSLEQYLSARLLTAGFMDAAFCAYATSVNTSDQWALLDSEYEARIIAPQTRQVSRQLGRQLLDTATNVWPEAVQLPSFDPVVTKPRPDLAIQSRRIQTDGWHHPIAFGIAANGLSIGPADASTAVLYQFAMTVTTAVVRLIGLDPVAAIRLVAAQPLEKLSIDAVAHVGDAMRDLPSLSNPLFDILSEDHDRWDMKLFAS